MLVLQGIKTPRGYSLALRVDPVLGGGGLPSQRRPRPRRTLKGSSTQISSSANSEGHFLSADLVYISSKSQILGECRTPKNTSSAQISCRSLVRMTSPRLAPDSEDFPLGVDLVRFLLRADLVDERHPIRRKICLLSFENAFSSIGCVPTHTRARSARGASSTRLVPVDLAICQECGARSSNRHLVTSSSRGTVRL